jgi:hypothetical protein
MDTTATKAFGAGSRVETQSDTASKYAEFRKSMAPPVDPNA